MASLPAHHRIVVPIDDDAGDENIQLGRLGNAKRSL